ncbi:choline dehydrogenase-like flavoprotein [Rhodoblastus acidophilus]|uniref:GMC oxidoreductase n=1 Tax=Rhodoblastus acidophilus TaxID=1074 RepID=UPI0022246A54|nr:GMC oxidoreductase [Rhodoblastus acidophilus]MCW2284290.1 choline dehydrogenase-like flavoprotein [Rhodoblastus acidophilus]MCW2333232.1 choline dehydrogenase-like flavoprotein [Rhodoblastus acidophilus]
MPVRYADGAGDLSQLRDPLVVGSGPVGIVLALCLARAGINVTLVEGGGELPALDQPLDLEAEFSASPLSGASVGRTRQIGGGLNLWGGQLASPHLCELTVAGQNSWPFDYAQLTPYFSKVTRLLAQIDVAFPPNNTSILAEMGALREQELELIATAWLKRPKLGPEIWNEIRESSRIHLLHGAFVDKILVDPVSARVQGVSALCQNGKKISIGASHVVLANGAIETSRLLLQLSIEGRPQCWSSLKWLGRGFNEHLDAMTATIKPLDARRLMNVFDPIIVKGTKYTYKLFTQTNAISSVAMLAMPGNIRNSLSELRILLRGLSPKMQVTERRRLVRAIMASARETMPLALRYLRHKRIGTVLRGEGLLRIAVEQPIRFDSKIELSTDRVDTRGIPLSRINWIKGQEEADAFLETTKKVKRWAESNRIASIEIASQLLEDPLGFAESADDGLHHAGGARMAARPSDGVVDSHLKVFGTDNLYCCGSSVFPRSGYANPTLLAMALAARLADKLIIENQRALQCS